MTVLPVALRILAAAAAMTMPVLALTLSPGCGCTDAGCLDNTSVTITTGSWEDGDYEIDLSFDGQRLVCGFALPSDPGEPTRCDSQRLFVSPPTSVEGTLVVNLEAIVARLEVELRRDGAPILRDAVRPDYEAFRPNGPFCNPVCESAEVNFMFD